MKHKIHQNRLLSAGSFGRAYYSHNSTWINGTHWLCDVMFDSGSVYEWYPPNGKCDKIFSGIPLISNKWFTWIPFKETGITKDEYGNDVKVNMFVTGNETAMQYYYEDSELKIPV